MATEQRDRDYTLYLYHTIRSADSEHSTYYYGCVTTPHGFVRVESNLWDNGSAGTWLYFIHDGRMYERYIDAFYQPRYLVTLARRFAADVVVKEATNG